MKITVIVLNPNRLIALDEGHMTYCARLEIPGDTLSLDAMLACKAASLEAMRARTPKEIRGLVASDFKPIAAFAGWGAVYIPSHHYIVHSDERKQP